MSTRTTINAFNIIQTSAAVSSDDGELIFSEIRKGLEEGEDIEVDFTGLEIIVSTFLNAAIGQLYGKYDPALIREHLSTKGLSNDDLNKLKQVVERAKQYFADKKGFSNAVKKGMNNG